MSDSAKHVSIAATRIHNVVYSTAFRVAVTLGFVGLIALGAHAKIVLPWTPVPVTLQTLVVLSAGAILGPLDGAAVVVMYLALGAFGVPLFAKANAGMGLSYFTGVTGGYLIGFFLAAIFVGATIRKSERLLFQALSIFCGSIIILTCGTLWWKVVSGMTLWKTFCLGFAPFMIGDVIKVSVTLAAYRACAIAQRRIKGD